MENYLPEGGILEGRFKGAKRIKKRNILIILILAITARLFFSVPFFQYSQEKIAFAQKISIQKETSLRLIKFKDANSAGTFKRGSNLDMIRFNFKDSKEKENKPNFQEEQFTNLVQGHPIGAMIPWIARQDKEVAAFLIGIAKKESNWGKHAPRKNGSDCFNYWGYRGGYNPTDSGYSCFDSPEQAVSVVGGRIKFLISEKIDTPARMVVWKCGSSCAGHNPADVKKWISDVSLYYNKCNS